MDSKQISNSSYMVLSEDCADCVFCFGCVGLVGVEFHILNRPFSREEYFKKLRVLEKEFGLERRR